MPLTRSISLSLLGAVMLVAGLSACESNDAASDDVEVVEPRLVETPNGERSFVGILVNQRSSALSIVQIEVGLYDDDGSRIETMRFDVNDIPAEDSVKFNQVIDSDRPIQQAQVQGILTP